MKAADEIARLRIAARDRPFDLLRQRIGRARIVFVGVAEKRIQIASGGVTDAKHQRVFRGEYQIVREGRIETRL